MTDPDQSTVESTVVGEDAVEASSPTESRTESRTESQGLADEPDLGTQAELDLGLVSTGDERVDAALAGLTVLPTLPVADHPGVFDDVHQGLHTALTELDED